MLVGWLGGMSGNVVEQETISTRSSLSGNEVSLPAGKQPNLSFFKGLRLLFVLAMEHTLLRMFLNTWLQILFPGDLHDDAL